MYKRQVKGYDKGEEYLSIWVHSIEDTEEGQCYRKSVDAFNKKYDGKYFADIEFIPRNAVSYTHLDVYKRQVVDLPHPDGPTNAINSFSSISKLKSVTEFLSFPAYFLHIFLNSIKLIF